MQRAISLVTKTALGQMIAGCQGHCLAYDGTDVHSHVGFLAVFAWVVPHLESGALLPLQTGRRRRVILRLTSLGRRKVQGTRTLSRK